MALSRRTRIWAILLSIPLVLAIAAGAALKMFFTGERLKEMAIPRLEEATGRAVSIGSISLSVFPALAVEIDSLSIANRVGEEFSAKPFVSLARLSLRVRLSSLIKGRLEVTSALLERPQILVEVTERGVSNYGDLGAPAPAGVPEQGHPQGAVTEGAHKPGEARLGGTGLILSNVEIKDGSIFYSDRQTNTSATLQGVNHVMQLEFAPVANEARLEGQTSVDNFSYGPIGTPLMSNLRMTMNEQLLYAGDRDILTVQKGTLSVQDMVLTLSGSVSGVTSNPRLDLTIASDQLNIKDLLSLAPKELMKKAEGMSGTGTARVRLAITGSISDSTTPAVSGTAEARGASIQYARLPRPITDINIVAAFTRTKTTQEFRLDKFSAALGSNPLSATLRVTDFNHPAVTMAVKGSMNLAEVKEYYPLEAGTELAGRMLADVNISGMIEEPAKMKAAGTVQLQGVTVKTPASARPLEHLQGTITFDNQVVEARKISLTAGKSDLALSFRVTNYLSMIAAGKPAKRAAATMTLSSNHLYTADVMMDQTSVPPPTGKGGKPPERGQERGAEKTQARAQRSGPPFPDIDMEINATIGTLTMEKFELSNVRATMTVSDGVLAIKSLTTNAFNGSISTRGTVNLQHPDQPLFDLALDMNRVDAHAMLSNFSSFGQRLAGTMTMNTTMKGALDDTLGLVPQTLNGGGQVQAQNGKLTGVKVNAAIASLLKLPDLETIDFKDWTNAFTLANGRIVLKDLKITALDADYIINGSQGLDGSLEYRMTLVLPERTSSRITIGGFAGQAVDLFRDATGRVNLDFSVGGTTDDPKVSLNTDAARNKAENLAKQKAGEQAKKLEGDLKKKGEDLLKGLFKKK